MFADWLTLRKDGVAILDARVTIETRDSAREQVWVVIRRDADDT